MQNTSTSQSANLDARIDQLINDLCQLALDERSGDTSEERRRLFDAVQSELLELTRQRSTIAAVETPAAVEQSEKAEKYNGWANYETWCVHLWLSNDPYTDERAREIVAHAWNNAADEVAADRDAVVSPRADAADALKEWLRYEENPLADQSSNMYTDLLGAALDTADWLEIAEAFQPDPLPSLEPAREDDEGEPEEPESEWRPWLIAQED